MTVRKIAEYWALLLAALSSGVLFGTKVSLGPSTKTFTPRTYVEMQQATVRNLRPVMGTLLPASVIANLALLLVPPRRRGSRAFLLNSFGFGSQLASVALTAAFELPTNSRVLRWSPDEPPSGWQAERDRWGRVHTMRTATSLVGLALVAAAALEPPQDH